MATVDSVLDEVLAAEAAASEDPAVEPDDEVQLTDLEVTAEHQVLEEVPENELGDDVDDSVPEGVGLDLVRVAALANVPLFYQGGAAVAKPHKPSVDRAFLPILEATVRQTQARAPASFGKLVRIQDLGLFTPESDKLHTKGRACDWEKLVFEHVTIAPGNGDHAAASHAVRQRYWAFAAICRSNSCYVLHGLYNSDHANHIHQDNGISPAFNTMESTVKLLQAILNEIFGQSPKLGTDGGFAEKTKNATTAAMHRLQIDGTVHDTPSWIKFLRMSGRLGFQMSQPV